MMYPYLTLPDETEVVHSHLITEDSMQKILVHFERPTEDGFDSARCSLPEYKWIYNKGFSESEISHFEQLLHEKKEELYQCAYEKLHTEPTKRRVIKCFCCGAETIETLSNYQENCQTIAENVPCRKCTQCGEVFFL